MLGNAPSAEDWNAQVVGKALEINYDHEPSDGETQGEISANLYHVHSGDEINNYFGLRTPNFESPRQTFIQQDFYTYERLSDSLGQLTIEHLSGVKRITSRIGLYYSGEHKGRHALLYVREVDKDTSEVLYEQESGPHTFNSLPEADTFELIQDVEGYLSDRGFTYAP